MKKKSNQSPKVSLEQNITPQKSPNFLLIGGIIAFAFFSLAGVILFGFLVWQNISYRTRISQLQQQLVELEIALNQTEQKVNNLTIEKQALEKKCSLLTPTPTWVPVNTGCVDSDANEAENGIYVRGYTTYINVRKGESIVYDECSGSKRQVNERYCYKVTRDDYAPAVKVYDCPQGCENGACVK